MTTLCRPSVVAGVLMAAGLVAGIALAETQEKKGVLVEVQNQSNERIKLELQEVLPSPEDTTVLRFTQKLGAGWDQISWNIMPIAPEKSQIKNLREIRFADEPLTLKTPTQEFLFYPVVLVPVKGITASWYWQGDRLSGVVRSADAPPRTISIPFKDIKVVRFVKEQ